MKQLTMLLCILLLAGCAKFPDTPVGGGKRLMVEFTVAGRIRPDYLYFLCINNSGDTIGSNGPKPVLTPPWGNGYAAGRFTHVAQYSTGQTYGTSTLYEIIDPSNPINRRPIGTPLSTELSADGKTLRFTIDMSTILNIGQLLEDVKALQINIIATNRAPLNPNDTGSKYWDALGNGLDNTTINAYLNIRTEQDGTWQNQSGSLNFEPANDVLDRDRPAAVDPDLDIVDWRVDVRS